MSFLKFNCGVISGLALLGCVSSAQAKTSDLVKSALPALPALPAESTVSRGLDKSARLIPEVTVQQPSPELGPGKMGAGLVEAQVLGKGSSKKKKKGKTGGQD